jgi:hypothetical protein
MYRDRQREREREREREFWKVSALTVTEKKATIQMTFENINVRIYF